jgi:hypothetical protein
MIEIEDDGQENTAAQDDLDECIVDAYSDRDDGEQ